MEAVLRIDGQERPLDPALVTSTDNYAKLRKILAGIFPLIGNASISHKKEGEKSVVTVVKRAESKGHQDGRSHSERPSGEGSRAEVIGRIIALLEQEPAEENPAITQARALRFKLAAGNINLSHLQGRRQGIEQVIKAGTEEAQRVRNIVLKLQSAEAIPSSIVPVGF